MILVIAVGLLLIHTTVNAFLLRRPDRPAEQRRPAAMPTAADRDDGRDEGRRHLAGADVAVLIPVRDEVGRIGACLDALAGQGTVVVLDDGSTDGTAALVDGYPDVTLITGRPLPDGWLGKPHACQQLADAVPGAGVLVFVDADVVLAPGAVAAAVDLLDGVDLLTPYPRIIVGTIGERLVQPLLQWSWLTFLPLRAMERSSRPSLAAAGGQFLVVRRAAYDRAGGHAAVRDKVLEDIELARAVKRGGGRITLADGSTLASCRMYTSWNELVNGYTKSLWASFGSPVAATCVVALLLVLYVAPPLILATGLVAAATDPAAVAGAAAATAPAAVAGPASATDPTGRVAAGLIAYLLGVAGRVVSARATGGKAFPDAFAHPVSIVVFAWLVARSYARRGDATWKGRPVRVPPSPERPWRR